MPYLTLKGPFSANKREGGHGTATKRLHEREGEGEQGSVYGLVISYVAFAHVNVKVRFLSFRTGEN
jgi:hypothetical protein